MLYYRLDTCIHPFFSLAHFSYLLDLDTSLPNERATLRRLNNQPECDLWIISSPLSSYVPRGLFTATPLFQSILCVRGTYHILCVCVHVCLCLCVCVHVCLCLCVCVCARCEPMITLIIEPTIIRYNQLVETQEPDNCLLWFIRSYSNPVCSLVPRPIFL